MSSYADVTAKDASQSVEEKSAKPLPELEKTTQNVASDAAAFVDKAASSVEDAAVSIQKEAKSWDSKDDFPDPTKALRETAADALDKGAKKIAPKKDLSTKIAEAAQPAIDALKKFISVASEKADKAAAKIKVEIKNPVVAANVALWTGVLAAAISYGAVVFKNGGRAPPLPEIFYGPNGAKARVAAVTAIIAALHGDALATATLYPKYKK
ncbi:hypothetical protein BZA70DRAFT_283089 [Myxozyma melibiosi]|uniref:Uncharacterized protein n=1 Tax=Myxozyma melibiosi TaxID=54550 RepID=A0ABR1F1H6_9ASCO